MGTAVSDHEPTMTADEAAEARLLGRLRAGQEAAFEVFVREHTPRSLAVARRFFSNDDDAQDAVQDAFLSAFKALGGFEGGSKLSTWLHRIVVNACLMKLRSRKARPERSIEDLQPAFREDGHHSGRIIPWDGPGRLEGDEARRTVRACIEQLPEAYRTVLVLRDIEGLDTGATARELGMSESAVKTRLHRARLALRTLLDPYMFGGDKS